MINDIISRKLAPEYSKSITTKLVSFVEVDLIVTSPSIILFELFVVSDVDTTISLGLNDSCNNKFPY